MTTLQWLTIVSAVACLLWLGLWGAFSFRHPGPRWGWWARPFSGWRRARSWPLPRSGRNGMSEGSDVAAAPLP